MSRQLTRLTLILVTTLLLPAAVALAQAPAPQPAAGVAPTTGLPAGLSYVTSIEGVHEYRLANGLQVLLLPDPTKPSITINVTYRVGSRHESYGETGMAHLLEHLLFKGSPKHPNIPQELKSRGARYNGTTWLDRTNYFETFTASTENLAWALSLEADRMVNAFVAKKDLDSEMTVVRNEFEIGENSPSRALFQRIDAAVFQWHSYGKSTIGNRSDIENVSIERLRAFYRTYYQPDNATLIVGGSIDMAEVLALVAREFGAIPRPNRVLEQPYTVEPAQDGERTVTVRRAGDIHMVAAAYRITSAGHADTPALRVLVDVLGSTPRGRLHKRLVETGKATGVGMSSFAGFDPGRAVASVRLRKEDSADRAREELISIVENVAAEPISADELAIAKAGFALGFERQRSDTNSFSVTLSEAVAAGDWRLIFWNRDRLQAVTLADLHRVAATYFKRDNRTVGLLIPTEKPERVEIPPRADITALLRDYRGGKEMAAGEAFDPSPDNIDRRTRRLRLPSGLNLAMLPKSTRGDRVHGRLSLQFGDADSLKGWGAAPGIMSQMLMRGTSRLDRAKLNDELIRLKASLFIGGGAGNLTASFSTTAENFEAVLRLAIECLREPAFPAAEFDQIKRQGQIAYDNMRTDPQSLAGTRMAVLLNAYPKEHPRYSGTLEEQREAWERASLEDVKRFYASLVGASRTQLAIVGQFDAEATTRLAEELLKDWKSPRPYARIPSMQRETTAGRELIETPDKANAVFTAQQNLVMKDSDPDYPALMLAAYVFGGGAMESRLGARLRQQEGLSYSAGASLSVGTIDPVASFWIRANFAPQNAARVEAAVREELARAIAQGFTTAEIESAKQGMLNSRRIGRTDDASLVGVLASNLFTGRTMEWSARLDAAIAGLTAEAASAAFRKHIDPNRLMVIKAGSIAAAAAPPAAGEQRTP